MPIAPAVVVRRAQRHESAQLAWLAALTFPLACPAGTGAEEIARHIATHLTPASFDQWSQSPDHALIVALRGDDLMGYALLQFGMPADLDAMRGTSEAVELSKIYVQPCARGTGAACELMRASLDAAHELSLARGHDAPLPLWLGTNRANLRAQAFYRKHGFAVVGTRTYDVGGGLHDDVVMLRRA